MSNEEKQLLLTDLCARLPYGVQMRFSERFPEWFAQKHGEGTTVTSFTLDVSSIGFVMTNINNDVNDVKPYLRPMASMTEKEQRYIWDKYGPSFLVADFKDAGDVSELFNYCQMNISRAPSFVDWLNEHHFDYRGLIPMGLALEAPDGMYNSTNNA